MNNKPSHNWRLGAHAPVFLAPRQELPKPRSRMFQFRVHCPGGLRFDVQARNAEDARAHVRRRNSVRINRVELIGEVKRHAGL